jgi:DNA-3-methyladenine glycosylase
MTPLITCHGSILRMQALTLLERSVLEVAPALIGWELLAHGDSVTTGGIIVETEAYRSADDPAAHCYRGPTLRNTPMWGAAGTIYVYLSYGLHALLNLTTGPVGQAEAVLIRALEPTRGLETMARRRRLDDPTKLTSGPAKLTQALGIGLNLNGTHLGDGAIELIPPLRPVRSKAIVQTTRIGISQGRDLPWRFYLKDSPYISRVQ